LRAAWLIHLCDMTHLYVRQPIYMCSMTRSCVWHDSFICATRLIHLCDPTHSRAWHDSFMCVIWLIHVRTWLVCVCVVTNSCTGTKCMHISKYNMVVRTTSKKIIALAMWCLHLCDMTHVCVWHHSFICLTCLINVCDMIDSSVWRVSFMCVTWLIHKCDVSHSCVIHMNLRYIDPQARVLNYRFK